MTTTERMRSVTKRTWNPMRHLRLGGKLGWESGLVILFPAAALDESECQKEHKRSQRNEQDEGASVDYAVGEVVHLVKEPEGSQRLCTPIAGFREFISKIGKEENGGAESKPHHRGGDLAAG